MSTNHQLFRLAYLVSRRLGGVPSLIYAGLYLGYVPFFAVLYCILPGSFYYSMSGYDPSTYRNISRLESEFREGIIATFRERIKDKLPEFEHLDLDKLTVRYNPAIRDRGTALEFVVLIPRNDKDRGMIGGLIEFRYLLKDLVLPSLLRVELVTSLFISDDAVGQLFQYPKPRLTADGYPIVFVPLTDSAAQIIYRFRDEIDGNLSNSFVHLDRMLYFSAVTLTTVGYGDIVPITPLMRFVVSSEVILGVVTIGLFLNALATERGTVDHPRANHDP